MLACAGPWSGMAAATHMTDGKAARGDRRQRIGDGVGATRVPIGDIDVVEDGGEEVRPGNGQRSAGTAVVACAGSSRDVVERRRPQGRNCGTIERSRRPDKNSGGGRGDDDGERARRRWRAEIWKCEMLGERRGHCSIYPPFSPGSQRHPGLIVPGRNNTRD